MGKTTKSIQWGRAPRHHDRQGCESQANCFPPANPLKSNKLLDQKSPGPIHEFGTNSDEVLMRQRTQKNLSERKSRPTVLSSLWNLLDSRLKIIWLDKTFIQIIFSQTLTIHRDLLNKYSIDWLLSNKRKIKTIILWLKCQYAYRDRLIGLLS